MTKVLYYYCKYWNLLQYNLFQIGKEYISTNLCCRNFFEKHWHHNEKLRALKWESWLKSCKFQVAWSTKCHYRRRQLVKFSRNGKASFAFNTFGHENQNKTSLAAAKKQRMKHRETFKCLGKLGILLDCLSTLQKNPSRNFVTAFKKFKKNFEASCLGFSIFTLNGEQLGATEKTSSTIKFSKGTK